MSDVVSRGRYRTPVERTVRYATMVDELTDAWAFVMEYVDEVGDSPSITVQPIWIHNLEDEGVVRVWEVCVDGMTKGRT